MHTALDLAWRSFGAGSFGIGAVVTDADGVVVATGRNRILEEDAGDDVLAGTSAAGILWTRLGHHLDELRDLDHRH